MRLLPLVFSLILTLLPQGLMAQTGCGLPGASDDKWPVAAPESVGLSSATLCPLVAWLDGSKQNNVHAVVVVRHGTLRALFLRHRRAMGSSGRRSRIRPGDEA